MPTLLQTLEGIVLDDSVLTALGNDLSGAAASATGIPAERIATIASLAGSIVLPRDADLLGEGAATLPNLVSTGLHDPDPLWSAVTRRFDQLGNAVADGVGGTVEGAFSSLQSIGSSNALDAEALLSQILTPLRDLIGQLGDNLEMQQLLGMVETIGTLRAEIEAAPAAIGALAADRIQTAITDLTAPLTGVVDQVSTHIQTLEQALSLDPILTELGSAQSALTTDFASLIGALDFTDEASYAALSGSIRLTDARLRAFAGNVADALARAEGVSTAFDPGAWARRLGSAARTASQSTVRDLFEFFEPWRVLLRDAAARLEAVSPALVVEPIRDAVVSATDAVGAFDLDAVNTSLEAALGQAGPVVDGINAAGLDVRAAFQNLSDTILNALNGIHLDGVVSTLTNQIASVTPKIEQLETEITALQGEATAAIADATAALTTLRDDLVEPDGAYRQHLEGFLNTIRDAVPDAIGDTIEDVKGQLQSVADRIASVELDPVFDDVLAKIEEMQTTLDEIEVETLSEILKGALAAALAVFKSLNFDEEVEKYLTEKFDEGVAFVNDEVLGRLQAELDKILNFLSAVQPSRLLEGTGIDEAYEDMAAQLRAFRPSEVLEPVLDAVTGAADLLDGASPGALLAPLMQPLNELQTYLAQTLSPAPVHAMLSGKIAELDAQLAGLDLTAFTGDITTAINRVRDQLNAALTVEGLLAPLQPVHDAALAAVDALDPAAVLDPIDEFRRVVLDAIDAADASALTSAMNRVANAVDGVSLPSMRTGVEDAVAAFNDRLQQVVLAEVHTQAESMRSSVFDALDAVGVLPDPTAEERRQRLIALMRRMEPLSILSQPINRLSALTTRIGNLSNEIESQLDDSGALAEPMDQLADRIRSIAGDLDAGAADIKQALRDLVSGGIQAAGVDEIRALHSRLRETVVGLGPDGLESAVDEVIAPVRDMIDGLPDPGAMFDAAAARLQAMRVRITGEVQTTVDDLRDQVQAIIDAALALLDPIDLDAVIASLDGAYASILDLKDRLIAAIGSLTDAVDAPYETVVGLIDDLNPFEILGPVLDEAYNEILAKFEGLDLQEIFAPILEAIGHLRDELLEGIRRVGDAFGSFQSASASIGA
jgi:division protein CdvB (Snf7/Vps24/ESCRT-III family)